MNYIFTLALLNAATMARHRQYSLQDEKAFMGFVVEYDKDYTTIKEMEDRIEIFTENRIKVEEMNRKSKGCTFGVNSNSDLTEAEYAKKLNLHVPPEAIEKVRDQRRKLEANAADEGVEDRQSIDWSKTKYMTGVKNNGTCGSCWAMTGTSVMEAMQAIKDDTAAIRLSELEAIDCTNSFTDWTQKNYGCSGGWWEYYWDWAKDHGAQAYSTYAEYIPKEFMTDNECRFQDSPKISRPKDYGKTTGLNDMKRRIKDGPLAIAVNASCSAFNLYKSGVIDRAALDGLDGCTSGSVDHAVTIVGIHYAARNDNDTNGGGDGSNGGDSSSDGNGDNSSHDDGAGNDDESEYVDPEIKCRKAQEFEVEKEKCEGEDEWLAPDENNEPICCKEIILLKSFLKSVQMTTQQGMNETEENNPESDKDYWIIENTWGSWWGKDGYIKVALDDSLDGTLGENAVAMWMTVQ